MREQSKGKTKTMYLALLILLTTMPAEAFAANTVGGVGETSPPVSLVEGIKKENDDDPLNREDVQELLEAYGADTFIRYEINEETNTLKLYFETEDRDAITDAALNTEDYQETVETNYYTTGDPRSNSYQSALLSPEQQEAYENGDITKHLVTYSNGVPKTFINEDGSLSHTIDTGTTSITKARTSKSLCTTILIKSTFRQR